MAYGHNKLKAVGVMLGLVIGGLALAIVLVLLVIYIGMKSA